MEASQHTMTQLFAQLGLTATPGAIDEFVNSHDQLANDVVLARASFWNAAQRGFLAEEIIGDADWAGVIDELNSRLHQARPDGTRR